MAVGPAAFADTTPTTANAEVANTDVIPVSSLEVLNTDATYAGLSTTVPVTVHTQAARSIEGGDALTASYQLTMPFVNADTYSGGLTFTAAAN